MPDEMRTQIARIQEILRALSIPIIEVEGCEASDEPGRPDGVYRWRKTFLCRPVGGHPSPGFEPEPEAAEDYAITEVRWFDLRDETDWGPDLLTDPFTYPQLVKARKRLGYLPWQSPDR